MDCKNLYILDLQSGCKIEFKQLSCVPVKVRKQNLNLAILDFLEVLQQLFYIFTLNCLNCL